MLHQTFDLIDIARVSALAFVEVLLSADNAIIIAIMVSALPQEFRRRALYIGIGSSFVLRAAAIFLISFILHAWWIELIGAAYLIYLSISHFLSKRKKKVPSPPPSFWKIVLLIELFDLAFAFDSIIAGIAFIASPTIVQEGLFHPKLWIVYVGGMIGLIFIRYSADIFSKLIDRLPRLKTNAYLLVGLIGLKLALEATYPPPGLEFLFWTAFVILLGASFLGRVRRE